MAEIVGAVDGLALAAQHGLADQLGDRLVGDLLQHAVEIGRPQPLAGRHGDAQGAQEFAQRLELGGVGLVVDAVEAGRVALLQRLRRRHVGQHHELLDQLVAVEPLAHADLGDAAVVAQRDQPLRQVEIERAALLARRQQDLEGAVERADHGLHQRRDLGVGRAVLGALHARVGEPRRRAHHGAVEAVALEAGPRRRSTSRRPAPGDPRAAPASTSGWTAPRAASARRGRGNRPRCRGGRRRGRAACRGARTRRRRRWRPAGASRRDGPGRARRTPRRRSRAHPRRRW